MRYKNQARRAALIQGTPMRRREENRVVNCYSSNRTLLVDNIRDNRNHGFSRINCVDPAHPFDQSAVMIRRNLPFSKTKEIPAFSKKHWMIESVAYLKFSPVSWSRPSD